MVYHWYLSRRVFAVLQSSLVEPWHFTFSAWQTTFHRDPTLGPWHPPVAPQEDDEGEAQKMPMEVGLSSRLLARLLVGSQLQFIKRTGPRTFPWHHVPLWFKTCE